MVEATAEHAQTDVTMPGAACFGILSAAVARKASVGMRQTRFPLHIWVVISAGSASGKTTVFDALSAPILEGVDADPASPRPRVRHREPRTIFEHLDDDDILEPAEPEPPRVTAEDVARAIAAAQAARGLPLGPRMVVGDTTPTALLDTIAELATGTALICDEAGFEGWLTGGGPVGNQAAATLNRVWSGGTVTRGRQGRGIRIDNAALTLLIGVQPKILEPLLRHGSLRARGFTLRMLYCAPAYRRRNLPGPDIRPSVENSYTRHIHALMALPGWGAVELPVLRVTAVAARLNYAFANQVEDRRDGGDLHPVEDYAGRFTSNVPRLAGLLHFARHAGSSWDFILSTPISEETMQHAVEIAEFFLGQGAAMFGSPILGDPPARLPTQQPQDLIEAVRTLVAVSSPWEGTPTQLLAALHRLVEEPRRANWPRSANNLTRILRQAQDRLGARGVELSEGRTGRSRTLRLTLVPPPTSSPPSPSR